jgi:hypothetical protein
MVKNVLKIIVKLKVGCNIMQNVSVEPCPSQAMALPAASTNVAALRVLLFSHQTGFPPALW